LQLELPSHVGLINRNSSIIGRTTAAFMEGDKIVPEAVVIFSGGPDSTAAALWALANGYAPELLTFQFRNKAQYGELRAAIDLARELTLEHTIFDFKSPMAHFEPGMHILMHSGTTTSASSSGEQRLKFGAGLILAAAANYALLYGKSTLIWGATKDDAEGGTLDYTQGFCDKMAELISGTAGQPFRIIAPFSHMRKYEIIAQQFHDKDDLFARSWSCKSDDITQCGECHPCIARRVSARLAVVTDKSIYKATRVNWPFTEQQLADVSLIKPEDLAHILKSEKPNPI
jgi:7-cyano-7-deazaguanine synthase